MYHFYSFHPALHPTWLCEWQSPNWPQFTLKGLEAVQKDFDWYHAKEVWNDKKFERAYDLAVLLVMCKYVSLIESALAVGTRAKPIPVLTPQQMTMGAKIPATVENAQKMGLK